MSKRDQPSDGAAVSDIDRRELKRRKVDGFKVANLVDDTNFTIRLGDYAWKLQDDVLTKESGFFRAALDGNFQESTTRDVVLHDDNAFDFARLLQFIYLEDFDKGPDRPGDTEWLPLMSLVTQRGTAVSEEEIAEDRARDEFDIIKGVWTLAAKYDVPLLRQSIAHELVDRVTQAPKNALDFNNAFIDNVPEYIMTYDLIHEYFSESPVMKELQTRMAEFLVLAKLQEYRLNQSTWNLFTCDAYVTPHLGERLEALHDKVHDMFMSNAAFAVQYASIMEEVLNKTWKRATLTDGQIRRTAIECIGIAKSW